MVLALGVAERLVGAPVRPVRARYPSILADRALGRGDAGQDGGMGDRDRADTVVLVVVWVLPLLGAAALLAAAGLPLLGGALLAVELVVGLCVYAARRRPARPGRRTPSWVVPAAMLGVVLAMLGVAALAPPSGRPAGAG
jgi:hypothetical protein